MQKVVRYICCCYIILRPWAAGLVWAASNGMHLGGGVLQGDDKDKTSKIKNLSDSTNSTQVCTCVLFDQFFTFDRY